MNHLLAAIHSYTFLIVFFLLVIKGNFCFAAVENIRDVEIIKNLQSDLLIYDEAHQNYLPYIEKSNLNFPTFSYYLNLKLYTGYKIQHCLPSGSSLFIDKKIVDFNHVKSCKTYSIDSLRRIYSKDTLFVTIYNTSFPSKELEVSIIAERYTEENVKEGNGLFLISRNFTGFNDFFIIGLIVLMILITILYNGNLKYFQEFYNLPKAFSLKIREESYLSVKNISGTYLLFLFVHSFLLGLISLVILHFYEKFSDLFLFINTDEFWTAALSWLQISTIIFFLLIAKYILVKAISQLFNIKGFSTIHFFDYIRMSISFFLLILISFSILLFAFSFEEQIWFEPLISSIIIFYIIRIIVLFLKLYKYAPFRNLHLFLYICSTELLPLMVGFKIFIK